MGSEWEHVTVRLPPEDVKWLQEKFGNRSEGIRRSVDKMKETYRDDHEHLKQRKEQVHGRIDELKAQIEARRAELADIEDRLDEKSDKLTQLIEEYIQVELGETGDLDPAKDGVNAHHPRMQKFAERADVTPERAYERYCEVYDLLRGSNGVVGE